MFSTTDNFMFADALSGSHTGSTRFLLEDILVWIKICFGRLSQLEMFAGLLTDAAVTQTVIGLVGCNNSTSGPSTSCCLLIYHFTLSQPRMFLWFVRTFSAHIKAFDWPSSPGGKQGLIPGTEIQAFIL